MVFRPLLCLSLAPFAFAGPNEDAILAAMRLSEKSSYSWTTAIDDNVRSYTVAGKTVRGGLTWVRLPTLDTLRHSLGRDAEAEMEAFFKDGATFALRVGERWKTPAELPKRFREFHTLPPDYVAGNSGVTYLVLDEPPPYSNLQFALSPPHVELATIVSSHTAFEVEDDTVIGTLNPLGASLLLVPCDEAKIVPLAAGGTFKLWMRNGVVVRYQLALEGMLLVGKRRVHVLQRSDTSVRDIGSTRLNVPAEVREKLRP